MVWMKKRNNPKGLENKRIKNNGRNEKRKTGKKQRIKFEWWKWKEK